jgi:hypothetical protein
VPLLKRSEKLLVNMQQIFQIQHFSIYLSFAIEYACKDGLWSFANEFGCGSFPASLSGGYTIVRTVSPFGIQL